MTRLVAGGGWAFGAVSKSNRFQGRIALNNKSRNSAELAIQKKMRQLLTDAVPGQRLPRVRDLMAEFGTSQRVVQRALAPFVAAKQITTRPGAGIVVLSEGEEEQDYAGDCLILYRKSESRFAHSLLIELVARLRRRGYRVVQHGFETEARATQHLEAGNRYRCCLLQTNFEVVSVEFLARIKSVADALVVDGVSVTGIDADVIGTNWREALSIAFMQLRDHGHDRISFLTSSHDARQIAMARREFLLLSGWNGLDPHPWLYQVNRLPGYYRRDELATTLRLADARGQMATALIVWGVVDGYLLSSVMQDLQLRLGKDISVVVLGSVDVSSQHVDRFDVVGNSDAEKVDVFENVVTERIKGSTAPTRMHYLPIYKLVNGSIELMMATTENRD